MELVVGPEALLRGRLGRCLELAADLTLGDRDRGYVLGIELVDELGILDVDRRLLLGHEQLVDRERQQDDEEPEREALREAGETRPVGRGTTRTPRAPGRAGAVAWFGHGGSSGLLPCRDGLRADSSGWNTAICGRFRKRSS